jgi:hypothetical protein
MPAQQKMLTQNTQSISAKNGKKWGINYLRPLRFSWRSLREAHNFIRLLNRSIILIHLHLQSSI